jgi:predicted anti-sigma-YlaC factor YlaD
MFSCEDVLAGLSDYMEEELTAAIRKQIEEHMVHCRSCRAVYDSTRKTLRIVTDTGAFELSEEVSARIAKNIRAKIQQKS